MCLEVAFTGVGHLEERVAFGEVWGGLTMSPTTVGLLAPRSKVVQLRGVGSSGDALGECWGALGGF